MLDLLRDPEVQPADPPEVGRRLDVCVVTETFHPEVNGGTLTPGHLVGVWGARAPIRGMAMWPWCAAWRCLATRRCGWGFRLGRCCGSGGTGAGRTQSTARRGGRWGGWASLRAAGLGLP